MALGALSLIGGIARAQGVGPEEVSPRKWLILTEGVGFESGKDLRGARVMHTPMIGGGYRFGELLGVEATLGGHYYLGSGIGGSDETDNRPDPPTLTFLTASLVTIRGNRATPFTALFGTGAGAFRLSDGEISPGVQAYLETGTSTVGQGTMDWGLRVVYLPGAAQGSLFLASVTLSLRTGRLRR